MSMSLSLSSFFLFLLLDRMEVTQSFFSGNQIRIALGRNQMMPNNWNLEGKRRIKKWKSKKIKVRMQTSLLRYYICSTLHIWILKHIVVIILKIIIFNPLNFYCCFRLTVTEQWFLDEFGDGIRSFLFFWLNIYQCLRPAT